MLISYASVQTEWRRRSASWGHLSWSRKPLHLQPMLFGDRRALAWQMVSQGDRQGFHIGPSRYGFSPEWYGSRELMAERVVCGADEPPLQPLVRVRPAHLWKQQGKGMETSLLSQQMPTELQQGITRQRERQMSLTSSICYPGEWLPLKRWGLQSLEEPVR